ncbi:hypothetical protein KKI93_23505 [Xenorhabdus bovienii]|uniref:hypothetical protein n=1 Tax=Xenorhabdus bovienii TaxID=40576 RepID=UPI0023B303C5|nr:hypothetical protein [Xenorhabdus bovienii]MDE9483959.1 hypothetical protein [Xenorhabdus bovienii]MDE9552691.1 hypothetical protein [Xenorhabdus bovienii]MDE9566870.1 hypothetical protein [Xenorhabdus bovienii]
MLGSLRESNALIIQSRDHYKQVAKEYRKKKRSGAVIGAAMYAARSEGVAKGSCYPLRSAHFLKRRSFMTLFGSVALSGHQVSSPVFERVQSDVPDPKRV